MPTTGKQPVFLDDKGDLLIDVLLSVTTLYCYVGTLMKLISIFLSYGASSYFQATSSQLLVSGKMSFYEGRISIRHPNHNPECQSILVQDLAQNLTQLALPAFRLLSA
jgi:hypothetical protein